MEIGFIYIGTSEMLARIILLDKEELSPQEEGYVQFRLEGKTTAKPMDKLIIRFYSPMITIGGGIILDSNPPKRKRYNKLAIEELRLKEKGNPKDILLQYLRSQDFGFSTLKNIYKDLIIPTENIDKAYKVLLEENKIIKLVVNKEIYLIEKEANGELIKNIIKYLNNYHMEHPLKSGAPKEEIRSKFFKNEKGKIIDDLLRHIESEGHFKIEKENISLKNFKVKLTDKQNTIAKVIEERFIKEGFNPPRLESILDTKDDRKEYIQVFQALVDWGVIIKINEEIYFHKESYNKAVSMLEEYLKVNKEINASKYRDLLNTSRKFAIALLEKFDQERITKRNGDIRTLL